MADALLQQLFGFGSQAAAELPGPSEEQWEEEDAWEDADGPAGDGAGGGGGLAFDADAAEVLRRIRSATLWFVSELSEGRLPEIELEARGAGGQVLAEAGSGEDGSEEGGAERYVLRPAQPAQRRALLRRRHPESAEQVARLWVLLAEVHALLLAGGMALQRELWYQFKTLEIFRSTRDVHEALQDAVALLQVPRSALGVTASSKGLVAGRLRIRDARAGTDMDCSAAAGTGLQIPGDPGRIARDFAFQTDAALVVVVEKDAVFQRLVQQRVFDRLPCVLVTGKGVPDLGTRAFLSCLASAFPQLPLAGLVDWNPAGANILSIYRFGSARMGLESPHYALPALGWLGARSGQLQRADAGAFQELTSRDRAQAGNLAASLAAACPLWAAELQTMLASGSKAEIEALDSVEGAGGLVGLLLRCLEEGDVV